MTMWDLDDIVGVSELAAAFRVGRAAVGNWTLRHDDFPKPLKEISAGPLYSLAQVTAWREGREWANAGPGSAVRDESHDSWEGTGSMASRNSVVAGIPDGVRLALTEAADHPDGFFPPGTAARTLGVIKARGWGRKFHPTYEWGITPDGREALARAELALKHATESSR